MKFIDYIFKNKDVFKGNIEASFFYKKPPSSSRKKICDNLFFNSGLFISLLLLLLVLGSISILHCSAPFNVDFPPPDWNISPHELFPQEISGFIIHYLEFEMEGAEKAYNANYGDKPSVVITAILCADKQRAGDVFLQSIEHILNKENSNHNRLGNTKFAHFIKPDNSEWFIWTNENWIFQIMADTSEHFQSALAAFKYIEG